MNNTNAIDRYIRLGARVFAIGGWILSIVFSANGFGLQGGVTYVLAGYFLALLVTMFEVVVNHYGKELPKTLAVICFLAYIFGCITNVIGLYQGRGAGGEFADYAIAIVLGIVLELYPEPLFLFSIKVKSSDLIETLFGLFSRRPNHRAPYPQYQTPPLEGKQGRRAREQFRRQP